MFASVPDVWVRRKVVLAVLFSSLSVVGVDLSFKKATRQEFQHQKPVPQRRFDNNPTPRERQRLFVLSHT